MFFDRIPRHEVVSIVNFIEDFIRGLYSHGLNMFVTGGTGVISI